MFDKVGGSKILSSVFFCLRHLPFAANVISRRDDGNSAEMGTALPSSFFFASHHSHQHSMGKKPSMGSSFAAFLLN